jgi:hypothetical protein
LFLEILKKLTIGFLIFKYLSNSRLRLSNLRENERVSDQISTAAAKKYTHQRRGIQEMTINIKPRMSKNVVSASFP